MGIKRFDLKGFNLAATTPKPAAKPKPAFSPLGNKPLASKPLQSKPLTAAKPPRRQAAAAPAPRRPTAYEQAAERSTFSSGTKGESKLAQFARELKAARAPAPADPNAPKIVID